MQLAHPHLTPTTCVRCQRSPAEGELFVDTGLNLNDGPVVNHIYFCPECAGLLASVVGWIDPAIHADLQAYADNMAEETAVAQGALETARGDAMAFVREVAETMKPKPAARKPAAKKADGPTQP